MFQYLQVLFCTQVSKYVISTMYNNAMYDLIWEIKPPSISNTSKDVMEGLYTSSIINWPG